MKNNKALYWFVAKAAGMFILWQVVYYLWLAPHTSIESWVTDVTATASTAMLRTLGYEADHYNHIKDASGNLFSTITINNKDQLNIGDGCNALTLVILFAGFIIAYPGNRWYKLLFIVVGSLAIFSINLVRCLLLIFNYLFFEASFDFNHKYTFTIVTYLCVFYFWMLWANRVSKLKPASSV
ncbi:MAG: archaeosortase/exosortase family protein [Cyclobacteriaceae bacterium]